MRKRRYYPAFLDIAGRKVGVIGGGKIAERKVISLLECDAQVNVISPVETPRLAKLAAAGRITLERRSYIRGDVEGCFLVIGATDCEEVNRQVSADAEELGVLCNIVDVPRLCSFIVPSTIARGDLQIAISTDGKCPALARHIRERLEELYGEEYANFVHVLGEIRPELRRRFPDQDERKEAITRLVKSDIPALIKAGDHERVQEVVDRCISSLQA